MMSQIYI